MATPTNFASLQALAGTLIHTITGGYSTISPIANHLFAALILIVIILSALMSWIWGEVDRIIVDLIRKALLFGFIFFIMQHWLSFTGDIAMGFTKLGLKVGGVSMTPQQFLTNPVNTLLVGWHITQQMNVDVKALQSGFISTIDHLPTILIYTIALVFVMIAFSILAFQLFISYIEFLLVTLAGLLFVPFIVFPSMKFISDRTFAYVFGGSAKLFAISLIVSVSSSYLSQLVVAGTPNVGNAFAVTIAAAFCAAIALSIPALAGSLISGAPQTSGSGVAMATAGVMAATGGASLIGSRAAGQVGARALGSSVRGIGNAASALTGGAIGGAAGSTAGAAAGGAAAAGSAAANAAQSAAGGGANAGGSGPGGGRANWMKQSGGLSNLNGSDHKAAMKAYAAWKQGPGAGMPHSPESYVEQMQQQTAAETTGGNPNSPE